MIRGGGGVSMVHLCKNLRNPYQFENGETRGEVIVHTCRHVHTCGEKKVV